MEQECKIGGEGLRNRDVVNKNRISELPEALLLHILSSLPTKTVVATSVLSKSWRSLWTLVPNLKFNSEFYRSEHHRFSEIVFRSLLSHKAPVLESLHLVVVNKSEVLDVGIWVGIAFAHHVRKLVLDLHNQEEEFARLPSVLWSYSNTLETLELKDLFLLDIPSSVCMKSLRKLHLDYVWFEDEESISKLFRGCPSLEDLFVNRKSNLDVGTFTIAVPSLQRLVIEDYFAGEGDGGYVINAPCLKYLDISGLEWLEFCLIEKAPELVEAKIVDVSYIDNENILLSLTSVKRLTLHLSPFKIKYPTSIIFYQLVYLELGTLKRWNLLSLMLDSCPKLQTLKLIDRWWYARKDCPVGWEWSQRKCVPECLLFHLETFMWTKYDWQREDDKEVAIYILKNARLLKKAFISTEAINSKELEKLEKRREMLNQLATEVRDSMSCHLEFECATYSSYY
ncbi:PREDICTED: FBD-associated F-box protein At3g49020-like [Camelina sativa]|uniref:FBD-associated F-box protein At3g49020-like n=1 Tax=Camelina sativa TaxID=90675 RepID=A0ABM0TH97_CAMSA|nr:PREDICTED: FBD-associated F-box protein At3g49020-like [Camelina sativa]